MENIRKAERSMLYTLGFELCVQHPYNDLVKASQALGLLPDTANNRVAQTAVNFLNDRCWPWLYFLFQERVIVIVGDDSHDFHDSWLSHLSVRGQRVSSLRASSGQLSQWACLGMASQGRTITLVSGSSNNM